MLATAMLSAMAVLGICIFKTHKEKNKPELAEIVRRVLQLGFSIVFVNFVSLLVPNKTLVTLCYCIYFVCADWMLYFLFKFSTYFMGKREQFEKLMKIKAIYFILIADCISVMLNMFFHHQFDVTESILFENELYYYIEPTPFFYVHYTIILLLAFFSIVNLYYRAFTSPAFYRSKYLLIAIVQTVLVGMNIAMTESEMDFSVVGYVVEGVCIYYCALVYTPQRLVSKTLAQVSQGMSVGLFVLDRDGHELYCNSVAEALIKTNPPVNSDDMPLTQWCTEQYMQTNDEFTKELSFFRGKEKLILKIQLQRLTDVKKQLQGGYYIITDRTEEYEKIKEEMYRATHDSLTDLYCKEHFYDKCEKYIAEHPSEELYIVCTDIKDFKMINDFMGTKIGDSVLKSFANMLRTKINGAVVYGRLGNDIFGLLMPKDCFDEESFIRESKNAFDESISKSSAFPTVNYIGVYEIINRELPISVMCDRARMAIRSIKGDYSKRTAFYDSTLRDNILYEQELISELNDAIAEEQFKMFLQPQISVDGKLLGAEALIRWHHPVRGQIMPGDFIPVFEKNGLISEVDKFIWECACKLLRKWRDQGRNDLYISVNISPRDFYFLNIYRIFTDLIKKYDLPAECIKLEITETAIVMDFQRQLDLITKLRKDGFIVEMDDFGSGYSSLNMLKDLHVDVLKIDMAFLKKAEDEERSKKILQMIISLSKQLDMPVITEGVETEEQVAALTEMGCDIFQGYYFAKPMPVSDFEKLYEQHNK